MRLFGLHEDHVKTLIKDTIETYSGQWRIIHESIQNSHDAIQLSEDIDQGKITIDLSVGENNVTVIDNGKGIPIEEFSTIFTLGGTAKKDFPDLRKILKGSQGVGIKATVFTSDFFEIETNYSEGRWLKRVEDCWNFLDPNFDDNVDDPNLGRTKAKNSWTKISYRLHDYSVRDFLQEIIVEHCNDLDIEGLEEEEDFLEAIELYFRTKTYIGCVQSFLGIGENLKPIEVEVNVKFDFPTIDAHRRSTIEHCRFLSGDAYHGRTIRRNFPAIYSDFAEIHNQLRRSYKVDRLYTHFVDLVENPPDPNLKKILIQKITPDQAEILLSRIRRDQNTGINRFYEVPEKLVHHRRILERINGIYLVIGPRIYLNQFLHLAPKQFISINGLPTNIGLNPPRGAGELGYLLNMHFIMDLDTTLGYGKRNIPSVVKGQADKFFADIFGVLRRLAKFIVGERESTEPPKGLWLKEEEYKQYMEADNKFKDIDIPMKLAPKEEQDVVCLFHELVGAGLLEGYFPFRESTNSTYDALFYISERPDHIMPSRINWPDLKIVEFKTYLSEIIEDFVAGKKSLQDIDLLVVWDDDYDEESEYIVSSLERNGIDPFPSAQKRIRSGTQNCQVLILKEFLFPEG